MTRTSEPPRQAIYQLQQQLNTQETKQEDREP